MQYIAIYCTLAKASAIYCKTSQVLCAALFLCVLKHPDLLQLAEPAQNVFFITHLIFMSLNSTSLSSITSGAEIHKWTMPSTWVILNHDLWTGIWLFNLPTKGWNNTTLHLTIWCCHCNDCLRVLSNSLLVWQTSTNIHFSCLKTQKVDVHEKVSIDDFSRTLPGNGIGRAHFLL